MNYWSRRSAFLLLAGACAVVQGCQDAPVTETLAASVVEDLRLLKMRVAGDSEMARQVLPRQRRVAR